jgi:predicted nicotinamide N-methyase
MPIVDPSAFIRTHTRLMRVPHVPEVRLHVADEATELWHKTEEELGAIGLPPPFWAFAWAGGQALGRHILDHPALVSGKRVLDFACGSGVVAIAAAKAGAARIEACDIDAFAIAAVHLNAAANEVRIDARRADLVDTDGGWDVVLAGDICYERDMAARTVAWLERLHARGAAVLVGDPGRAYLPRDKLVPVAMYRVPVTRSLEDAEIKTAHVWQFRAPP